MMRWKTKIKAWLGPVWWYAAAIFCVQRVGDVANLYAGLWLVPKWVPDSELGALLPLGQVGGMLGLPLAILLTPFSKYLNAFGAREEFGKVKALLLDALFLAGVSAVAIAAYTWLMAPLVFERLRIKGTGLVWLLCGIALTSVFLPILNNALQALKKFRCLGVVGLTTAPVRLVFLWVLLPFSALFGFFSSQFFSYVVTLGVGFWGLREILSRKVSRESYRGHWYEMFQYTLPITVLMVVNSLSTTIQLLVIRQRLPDVESAAFYFGSRFSELPNMLWSAIAVVFFPVISEAFETGRDTRRMLFQVLLFTVGGGAAVAVGLGAGIEWLFGVVGKWKCYQPYAYLVVWMSMTNVFRMAFTCFSSHEMACRRFGFIRYSVPLSVLESVVLVSLTGYGFFTPYLPHAWVEWMGSLRAARLEYIVGVILFFSFALFVGIVLHMLVFAARSRRAAARAAELCGP
jgi:O-antigen/teichoic acid export membrane protein